ncbi:phospholipase D-like domain-containing protein [Aggregatibacter actinomycetemcomitans]|uniref:phospholipase D-like domain-containing protein n=1 Tax=Aggregatibacter actinomycetemcomitans TaxID=714 RepID=UPI0021515000|nr:phospholipase D-like domain-containing protein [Aggregatibacter actinomycetemcomitans]
MTEQIRKLIRIPASKYELRARVGLNWFLYEDDKNELFPDMSDAHSQPVSATFKALVNGEEAFGAIYEKIEKAQSSVEIAIWGFQPSMYFKRDGKSLRIGDLLIKKALEGVKVRLLVWSMWLDAQTRHPGDSDSANLGNKNAIGWGRPVKEISDDQMQYDYLWYKAIEGDLHTKFDRMRNSPDGDSETLDKLADELEGKHKAMFPYLWKISEDKARLQKIQYKNRRITFFNDIKNGGYADRNLPWTAELTLGATSSHHQKMVLIDYERPELAVGFVMEHNMLDNYWDDSTHTYDELKAANAGKNVKTPLQDVSGIVTGQVLWDLNYNFCQSWDRNGFFDNRGNYDSSEHLTKSRSQIQRTHFQPNSSLGNNGEVLRAQIVRTYDNPRVKDIMKVYLKNIQQVTSYIYTENQYFRWPVLVEEFLSHWKKMRKGRAGPIHWFVVTNSSDGGISAGTYTTSTMLALLGRQDMMPNVARQVRLEELEAEQQALSRYVSLMDYRDFSFTSPEVQKSLQAEIKTKFERLEKVNEQIERNKKAVEEAEHKIKNKEAIPEPDEDPEFTQNLGYVLEELEDTPGIKVHICTLVANNAWQEVYVHSKVTLMDDAFTIISSANLNTRSMEKDSELGIILEAGEVAQGLRKRLWGLHTGQDAEANPDNMHNYNVAKEAFKIWGNLMKENLDKKRKGIKQPLYPLRQFFRPNPDISRKD